MNSCRFSLAMPNHAMLGHDWPLHSSARIHTSSCQASSSARSHTPRPRSPPPGPHAHARAPNRTCSLCVYSRPRTAACDSQCQRGVEALAARLLARASEATDRLRRARIPQMARRMPPPPPLLRGESRNPVSRNQTVISSHQPTYI